jgi:Leucine-rich repeat (LRR) protein
MLLLSVIPVSADSYIGYKESKKKSFKYKGDTFVYRVCIGEKVNGKPTQDAKMALPYGDGAYIEKVSSRDEKLTFPKSIKGMNVVSVRSYSDNDNSNITSVNLRNVTELKELDLYGFGVKKLDLSKNIKLREFNTSYCRQLRRLNLSKNKKLKYIQIVDADIRKIDLSKNKALKYVSLNWESLKNIRFSKKSKIRHLDIAGEYSSLNLSALKKLKYLEISSYRLKSLKSIKFGNRKELTILGIYSCDMDSADLSGFTALKKLYVLSNVSSLKLPNSLIYLDASGNKLLSLDTTLCTKLKGLNISSNRLTDIDVSNNRNLRDLSCFNNLLKEINISKNRKLETLYCFGNDISTIDISSNPYLDKHTVYCDEDVELIY